MKNVKKLILPATQDALLSFRVGDVVELYGVGITARDIAHKYIVEKLIEQRKPLSDEDRKIYEELKRVLKGGFIYHCGPIIRRKQGRWRFISAGPTTSIRTELYQHKIIKHFNVRVIVGKGGMGELTLKACKDNRAIYLHGIGGAGVLNAEKVVEVLDVFKLDEFGVPEAIWKIRVEGLTAIVTMDTYGESFHDKIAKETMERFYRLIKD